MLFFLLNQIIDYADFFLVTKESTIGAKNTTTDTTNITVAPTFNDKLPNTNAIQEKSASENVADVNPKLVNTGITAAGKNVINKPCTNEPNKHPLQPPSALPNTPAVAPQKK